jgi:hypothetical protein
VTVIAPYAEQRPSLGVDDFFRTPIERGSILFVFEDIDLSTQNVQPPFSEPSSSALSSFSNDEWRVLTELFDVQDGREVRWLLGVEPDLRSLLYELLPQVWRLFGWQQITLEYFRNEERPSSGELFASIATTLHPNEARALLDALDQTWWLHALPRARGLMNIGLKYL